MNSLRTLIAVSGLLSLSVLGTLLAVEIDSLSNFNTGFEAEEGYSPGFLLSDPVWSIGEGSDPEVGDFGYSGSLGLHLGSGDEVSIDFSSLEAPTVGWVDFYLKPAFNAAEDLSTAFPLGQAALTGFVTVGENGEVYVLDGDGGGNGIWTATGYVVPLNGNGSGALNWMRMTYRLDYTSQRWDLFLDNSLQMIDIGFVDASAPPLSRFTLGGSAEGSTQFDQFTAGFINPLFSDADNDGMDDLYESGQGLSTITKDRDGDLDLDSIPNIAEYMDGLEAGNADSDGDGVHDGAEVAAGANPLIADAYELDNLPYAEGFESYPVGDLTAQSIWRISGGTAVVQGAQAFAGVHALELLATGSVLELKNHFDGSSFSQVWLDFHMQVQRFASLSDVPLDRETTAMFYFLANDQIAILDGDGQGGGNWIVQGHQPDQSEWTRVTVAQDYGSQQFELLINSVPVEGSYGFANKQPYFNRLMFKQESAESESYLDQISVSGTRPGGFDSDGDGLIDEDEDLNGNGLLDVGETDPLLADTDGDGIGDGAAVKLRLWLRSDTGVTADAGGLIQSWEDQSIYQEDASQSGAALQPALIDDAYNGQPAVRFDGVDDYLEGLASFDASAGDFTMIVVHRKTGGHDKSAPFSYSTLTTSTGAPLLRWGPQANNFGLNNVGVNADGVYVDLGPDHADKLYIASAGRSGGVNGLGAAVTVSALAHNESVQSSGTQSWTSGSASGYYVGKKAFGNDHMFGGDVLEVLVYDGVLTTEQSLQVNQQLAVRYGLSLDLDFDGLSDEWEEATFGSFDWTAMDDPDGDGMNNLREFNLGTDANAADTTDLIQSNASLRLHLDASAAVLDANGLVEQLPDLSGWNEHATQDDPSKRPALALSALGGQDALDLDGVDDYLAGSTDFDVSAGDFTLIAVARQNAGNGLAATLSYSSSDTALGAPLLRWNRPAGGDLGINDVGRSTEGSFVSLGDHADQVQLVSVRRSGGDAYGENGQLMVRALSDLQTLENTTVQSWTSGASSAYFIGRKKTTPDGNNDLFSGQVAELLVFDRALSNAELQDIEEHLGAKYQIALDLDSDGWADSYEAGLFGDLSQSPESDFDGDGVSNARELSLGLDPLTVDAHSPVLTVESLALWLSADQGVTTGAGGLVSAWSDISGRSAQIGQGSAAAQPVLVADAIHSQPAVQFDGVDDYLLGDAGFAPASGDYTLFVVHRRSGGHDKAATLSFNQPAGSTGAPLLRWGPDANHLGINNVGVNADGVYADLGAGAGDFQISSIIRSVPSGPGANPQLSLRNESSDRLCTAAGEESWSSALSSEFALARKADGSSHYFGGEIAEVILFDAALSGEDLSTIETYLRSKYAIDSDPDDDGLDNATELSLGTDPGSADSDGDTLPDGWEHRTGLDPLNHSDAAANPDGDYLTNLDEYAFETDPLTYDSSGDGVGDGYLLPGFVKREVWEGINLPSFAKINSLLYLPGFPDSPTAQNFLQRLETPQNSADFYADRTRGFIVPTESKEYTLSIVGDNIAELWLSSDAHAYNMRRVAYVKSGSGYNNWTQSGSQSSEAIFLESGVRYYFELLHLESTNNDYFRVAWESAGAGRKIIASPNLLSWIPDPLDADDDGLADTWEQANGFDPSEDGSSNKREGFFGDYDSDGILNFEEIALGTDAREFDSDSDGIGDWFEAHYFETPPTEPTTIEGVGVSGNWKVEDFNTHLKGIVFDEEAAAETKLQLFASCLSIDHRTSEQTSFFYQSVSGDFSVTYSFDEADQRSGAAKVGLMARESLSPDSRHLTLINPWRSLDRYEYFLRSVEGQANTPGGHLILNHGESKVWVRLVRQGNTFTAYMSVDNVNWSHVATQSLDLPHTLYLGFSLHRTSPWGYLTATVNVTEWNTDFDLDGIWDADEPAYGTSVTSADSDGDGYSDYEEIYGFFTDPAVVDLAPETIADSNTGAESVAGLGDWIVDGAVTYSRGGRGSVEYEMTLPEDAIYRISLEGQSRFNETGVNLYNVKVSVDGVYIGRIFLNDVESEAGAGRILSPWLKAGTHTLRFYVDNTYTYRSLQINEVSVGYVGGPDADQDTIPDWMTKRLSLLNGFDNAAPSGVTQSPVSPFCLTGRSRYLDFSASTDVQQLLSPLPAFGFYTDVTLDAANDTHVTIDFENDGLSQSTQIEWVATNVADTPEMTIRKGDALLLTAFETAALPADSVVIDLGDGSTPVTTTVDTPLEATFASAGEFIVTAAVNSVSYQMTVTVMEAELGESISLLIDRDFTFQPAALSEDAAITIGDAVNLVEVTEAGQPRTFDLTAAASEPAVLAASTPSGAVLDHVDLKTFYLASSNETRIEVTDYYNDGAALVEIDFVLSDFPPDLQVVVRIFVGGITFDDGSIEKILTADDFDEVGRTTLKIIMPFEAVSSVCHRIYVYSGDEFLGQQ